VEGNAGFAPTDNSFFNVTAQVSNHGHSDRGYPDPRVADATTYPDTNAANFPGAPNNNLIYGDAETHLKLISFNSGIDLSDSVQFYAFGTYGDKLAESYENYRVPGKVSYCPIVADCAGASDAETPAEAALSLGPQPNGQLVTIPPAGADIATYPLPLGFNPLEQSREQDFQLNSGFKGGIADWTYDVAQAYGEDHMDVYTVNSANAALYAATGASPSDFYDGKFITTQAVTTADITRDFDVGMAAPMTLAFGGEYRRETYVIGAGDWSSYAGGGAQSFAGYSPLNATDASRNSKAGYLDLVATPVTGLKLDLAGRYEDYSDFGSATVGKFTARYDFNPMVALRGTLSTGFRAPTLAEEYYTGVNVGPNSAYGQLAPDGKGAALLGLGSGLKPEHSTNMSLGIVLRPLDSLTATLDAYHILVTDRILATGNISGSFTNAEGVTVQAPAVINALLASGLSIDPAVIASGNYGINIFANGADTITNGVDLQLISPQDFSFGHIDFSVAATYSYTTISRVVATPTQLGDQLLFDTASLSAITTQSPRMVLNFGAHYSAGVFYADLHEIVYGAVSEWDNDDGDTVGTPPASVQYYINPFGTVYYKSTEGTVAVTNLELGLNLRSGFNFAIGAQNLFNRYPPSANPYMVQQYENAGDYGIVGLKYLGSSPLGIDGGYYYARIGYKF
ncbi:MAG TPA: TonB-dependent receptor, partial [Steroidobacteraceae bacterium]|nr:TonB-dependent receptor [Steroidobacteraceae bacterium]